MVAQRRDDGPPPGPSAPAPPDDATRTESASVRGSQQQQQPADSSAVPAALTAGRTGDSGSAAGGAAGADTGRTGGVRQETPDAPTGQGASLGPDPSGGNLPRGTPPRGTPPRGNHRSWTVTHHLPVVLDDEADAPLVRAHGAISTILTHGILPTAMQPGARSGAVYLISIHDEDRNNKASAAALRRLKTVPLNEVPMDERECTICYEPLEEVPEEALQQQAEQAAADTAAAAAAEAGSEEDESREQSPLEPKDGHAPLQLPCKHAFGASCLRNWLETSTTCPLCRKSIEPYPSGGSDVRRHIIHRQEDFDRLWSSLVRSHPERNASPGAGDGDNRENTDTTAGDARSGAMGPRPGPERAESGMGAARDPWPLPGFSDMAFELGRHAEHHMRLMRERQQQQQQQQQEQPEQPNQVSTEDGAAQRNGQDVGQNVDQDQNLAPNQDQNQDENRNQDQDGSEAQSQDQAQDQAQQDDPQGARHMHFHFTLDDAFRENGENSDTAPQEFVFDIRILPNPTGAAEGTADRAAPAPNPNNRFINRYPGDPLFTTGDESIDYTLLRARQHEEMLRAVRAAAEASLSNERSASPAPDASASLDEPRESANVWGQLPRPLFSFQPSDLFRSIVPPPLPTGPNVPASGTEGRANAGQQGTRSEENGRNEGDVPMQHTAEGAMVNAQNRYAPAPPISFSVDNVSVQPSASNTRQDGGPRPPAMTTPGTPTGIGAVRGDTSISESLFQAFRRHFAAPDSQQELLSQQLNERLPPPPAESQSDSMIVDSDSSRSATPSADAPAVDQSDDTDISRSGPTRRAGRRRHPYPRS